MAGWSVSARRPVHGADRVARFLLGIATKVADDEQVRVVELNGCTGIGVFQGKRLTSAISLTVHAGLITRVDIIRAPAKLLAR